MEMRIAPASNLFRTQLASLPSQLGSLLLPCRLTYCSCGESCMIQGAEETSIPHPIPYFGIGMNGLAAGS